MNIWHTRMDDSRSDKACQSYSLIHARPRPSRRRRAPHSNSLVHLADELVDVGLPVTEVTALDEVLELPCPPATSGVGKLEWPEEVGGLIAMLNNERL